MELIDEISLQMKIQFKDEVNAKIVYNAIIPELNFSSGERRSKINIQVSKNTINLTINSTDFVILRAIVNSHLRWFNTSLKIIQLTTQ